MKLTGSCHCKAVTFTFESRTPYPFILCYCSICRKTGGHGSTINIMGDTKTLDVKGSENLSIYRSLETAANSYSPCRPSLMTKAKFEHKGKRKEAENLRHFCKLCGCHLYAWAPVYAEYFYPTAAAIDTDLPEPPERYHIMRSSQKDWIQVPSESDVDKHFDEYPDLGIEEWHRQRGLITE